MKIRKIRTKSVSYLRDNILWMPFNREDCIVNISCNNGCNLDLLKSHGYKNIIHLDVLNGDIGNGEIKKELPINSCSTSAIICNYLMAFLNADERYSLVKEINRIARPSCILIIELSSFKKSYASSEIAVNKMQDMVLKKLKWEKIRYDKHKFIARKTQ